MAYIRLKLSHSNESMLNPELYSIRNFLPVTLINLLITYANNVGPHLGPPMVLITEKDFFLKKSSF